MLLATMAMVAAAVGTVPADAGVACSQGRFDRAQGPQRPEPAAEAKFRKLIELPPANLQLTVLRTEDGCIVPVIVRYSIGAPDGPDR